jgi:hypothetical protein
MEALLKLFFVLVVLLTVAGVGYAQAPSESKAAGGSRVAKAEKKKVGPKVSRAVGEVAGVDPGGGTLRIKTKDAELLVTPGSKGARQALQRLKLGDKVTVFYFEKEGYLVAPSIARSGQTAKPRTK